ncbi:hypothetical protein Fmac_011431 [Flemingia macrophylla]|uniref:Uncharacterized protein n=1 Tax=Flemingia macrophylla TaxID=520843 RepID=A0ABD1MMG0_9FABA
MTSTSVRHPKSSSNNVLYHWLDDGFPNGANISAAGSQGVKGHDREKGEGPEVIAVANVVVAVALGVALRVAIAVALRRSYDSQSLSGWHSWWLSGGGREGIRASGFPKSSSGYKKKNTFWASSYPRIPRMASRAIFSSLRRRRSPTLEAFLALVDLSDVALRKNSRSLIRRVVVFHLLLEYLRDSDCGKRLPPTAVLCLKELYLLLYRSKILLNYCAQSSKLWLLIQNHSISGHFHDLNQEISTLLDVFPVKDVGLSNDIAPLGLSIFDTNKSRIMDENGCLGSIVDVLRFGHTTVAALVGALGNEGVVEERPTRWL